ncbi:unnamed protein product [marine sediment metagenome]|uniref:Uncharacterized protein n=1 Tax=marine sediment metagenome TaxID=412755 RepID=X1S7A4_9ZZZZ
MEEKEPNRAERRRQEKEAAKPKVKATCTECKEGPCDIAPKTYDKCPVCGCPARFTIEAMKGDLHLQDIFGRHPALFAFEYLYDTPTYEVKLAAVGASCVRCGVFYTILRDKLKGIPLVVPKEPSGDGPGLILPH